MTTTSDASSTASDADSTDSDDGQRRAAAVRSGPDESDGGERAAGETGEGATTEGDATKGAPPGETGDSSSLADRLDALGTVVWSAFLAAVVVFTLIPVVGLAAGYAPFDPPPTLPYFAFLGLAFLGTVALVGGAILDV